MNLVNEEMTMATADNGTEYVSEWETVYTDTDADGTEYVAEITTTASEDDPTDVESHMTVTATAEDGTETVTEYIANEHGTFKVEPESEFEKGFEEAFGVEIPDDLTPVEVPAGTHQAESANGMDYSANHAGTDFGGGNMDYSAGAYGDYNAYEPAAYNAYDPSHATTDTTTASDYLYTGTGPDIDVTGAITGDSSTTDTSADMQYNAEYNSNYADYYQDQANIAHDTAIDYADHGYYDTANVYAESAADSQDAADHWMDAPID